ncbi:hypothetical protein ACLBWT_10160 [Paenibacillus sp. D51F]
MLKETKLFSIYMLHAHDIVIDERKLAWESNVFCREELDEQVVPVGELQGLPSQLTISCSTYDDEFGSQWLWSERLANGCALGS